MTRTVVSSLALIAAVAGAVSLASAPAAAVDGVKCYGVAKAGMNSCANAAGTHSCAGQSTADYDGGEWSFAESADACTAMNGSVEPFEGPNPNIQM